MADKKKKLTSDKIAESIFDASSIIAEAKMKNLAQDKTYKATVVGTSRAGEGLYSCKLDELVFTAVGGINEQKVDDIVQVNVPQDNWDNQKNIIGKGWVSESAGDATMPFDNFYVPGYEDFKNPFWSTSAETHLIANAAAKLITEVADAQEPPSAAEAVETSVAIANGTFLYDAYDKAYTTLGVRAKFCTKNLVNFPVLEGNYGLRLELFADTNSVLPLATYELNALNITGNVYALLDYTEFEALFKMDTSVLANLKSAKLSLFQNGQFYQMDGNTLESDFLRYDEGVFDENTNSRAKPSENISIKDIQLFWGYDARDFETDNLKLSCTSSLYYRARDYNETKDKVFKYNYIVKDKNNRLHEVNDAEPSLWYRIGTTEWVKSSATLHKETQTFEQEISDPQMNSAANSISFKARIEKENYNDETGEKYEYIDSNVVTLQKKTDGTEKDKADAYDPETGKDKSNEQEGEGGNANIINYITEAPDFKNDKPHLRREWLDALGIVLAQGEHHEIHSNELTVTRMMHDPVGNPIDTDIETLPLLATVDYYFLGSALHGQITLASPVGTNNQVLEERPYTASTDQNPKRRDLIKISGQALRQLIPPNAGAMYDPNEHSIGCFYFGDIESTNCGSISDIRIVTETVTIERDGEQIEEVQVKEINGFICNNLGPKRMDNILINHPFNYTISDKDLIGGACDHHNTYMSGQIAHNTSTGNLDGCNVAFGYNNIAKSAAVESQGNYQAVVVAGRDNDVDGTFGTVVGGYKNYVHNIGNTQYSEHYPNIVLGNINKTTNGRGIITLGSHNTTVGKNYLTSNPVTLGTDNYIIENESEYCTFTAGAQNAINGSSSFVGGTQNTYGAFTINSLYSVLSSGEYASSIHFPGWGEGEFLDSTVSEELIATIDSKVNKYRLKVPVAGDDWYKIGTNDKFGDRIIHSGDSFRFFFGDALPQTRESNVNQFIDTGDTAGGFPIANLYLGLNDEPEKDSYGVHQNQVLKFNINTATISIVGMDSWRQSPQYVNASITQATSTEGYEDYTPIESNCYWFYNTSTKKAQYRKVESGINYYYNLPTEGLINHGAQTLFGKHNHVLYNINDNYSVRDGLISGENNLHLANEVYSVILGKNNASIGSAYIFGNENYQKNSGALGLFTANVFGQQNQGFLINDSNIFGYGNFGYVSESNIFGQNNNSILTGDGTNIFGVSNKIICRPANAIGNNNNLINSNCSFLSGNANIILNSPYSFTIGTKSSINFNGYFQVGFEVLFFNSTYNYKIKQVTFNSHYSKADLENMLNSNTWVLNKITPSANTKYIVIVGEWATIEYGAITNITDTFIGQWENNQWNRVGDYDIPSESAAIIGQHDIGYGSDFFVTGKYNRNYGDNSIILGSANFNNSVSSFITGYGNINGDRININANQAIEPAMSGISSFYYNPQDRKFYLDLSYQTAVQGTSAESYQDKTYTDENNNSIINIPYEYNSTFMEWQANERKLNKNSFNYINGVNNYCSYNTKSNFIFGINNSIYNTTSVTDIPEAEWVYGASFVEDLNGSPVILNNGDYIRVADVPGTFTPTQPSISDSIYKIIDYTKINVYDYDSWEPNANYQEEVDISQVGGQQVGTVYHQGDKVHRSTDGVIVECIVTNSSYFYVETEWKTYPYFTPARDYAQGTICYNPRYGNVGGLIRIKVDYTSGLRYVNADSIYNTIFGNNNISTNSSYQFIVGKYNQPISNALFIIGNGSLTARSNAMVVNSDGNITISGTPSNNNHVATKKYVDDAIAALPASNPVSWNQIQTSTGATKIAEITIGQTTTDVYAPTGGGGGGSTVSWSQTQQTGTAIATITIDGVAQTVYAPTGGGVQFTDVTGTLTAGQTSITLSDAAILTTSTFDFYTDTFGVSPTAVSVATGSITLTFAAQANNLGVKVRVW